MEYKPTVTYTVSDSFDESLFLTLITHLRKVLRTQTVEWKRSYGRTPHSLTLDVKFLPLTDALLQRNDLVTRPYYHLFWTDCNEIEAYRSSVKPGITSWLEKLKTMKVSDWMIVVVTGDGFAKMSKPKIPLVRTPVIDRIKTDFCAKNPEKIVILHDPLKESSKTLESWASLALKLANCTISSLEQAVTNYEDRVRSERERRNDNSWNFCSYFILQEELAFVFEMLSLHEEALIQYNELDAMFTQYILNAHVGDVAHWLSSFTKPVTRWKSLSLWRRIDGESRQRLIDGTASLIDVRNYLFSRHCHLLFAVEDLKRVTELMHTFLHSSTLELDILEIDIPAGAKDCWVFMNCMEITQSVERKRDDFLKWVPDESTEICMNISHSELQLEIANLWDLARSKLLNLGELCGLMPDIETSSDNLQLVVDLISGMGDEEERDGLAKPPSLILRNALSSKENFRSKYLELSELAMGIFKHTDRYRFARNLGKDLANFYMRSGEPGKAESFFLDCVRMYNNEAWPKLNADASERLAGCYKQMCNVRRYVRMCCALMCNPSLSDKKKSFYCDELRSLSTDFGDNNLPILLAVFARTLSIQFNPAQTSIQHKSAQRILLRVHSKAPKPMHFHSLQLSLRHQDLSTDDNFEKSTIAETLEEDEEYDALTYTTFSSDDEDNNIELLGSVSNERRASHQTKRASISKHLKRRRYLSGNSFDSVHVISQKTTLGPDGTVKLIPIEEPFTELSKCVANRLPQTIQVTYEIDEKEEGILWAGITCRSAKTLLKRQDSYQSVCSIHASSTNIVMEEYQDILEVKNVVLHPGDNIVEVPVKTINPGHYTLRQLRFSINKIHFVLPRILPVISYTVTKDKPKLTLSHQPRLYCNMVQDIVANLSLEDYELITNKDNRKMFLNFPKHLKILKLKISSARSKNGDEITVPSTDITIEEAKCCIELPEVPSHTVISLSMTCICTQPVALELGHRHHRRTQSAPPTTVHKHVQSNYIDYSKVTQIEDRKSKGFANLDIQLPSSPFARQNGASPVRKFLTFMREVAEKRAKSSEKSEQNSEANSQYGSDEFLEVVLDGNDVPGENWSARNSKGHSPSTHSLDDTVRIKSSSLEKAFKPVLHAERIKPNIRQRHTLAVHDDGHSDADHNKVLCNISFTLPWDDVPPVSISAIFTKLMQFSNKLLQSYSRSKRPDSTALQNIITVRVENCSPHDFFLSNCFLKSMNHCVTTVGLQKNETRKLRPAQKASLAWKAKCSSSPMNYNVHFHADVSTDGCVTPANQVSYKFEVENVQPLYTVSMHIGADGSELVVGQMTSLNITVKRIRRDPEQEHTRGDQQLLMYQVIDTRGRWAVCGKSTGVLSIPLSSIEAADLGPPVAKASLEIMPLVDGYLHRPIVVLQRYLKRRSGEFDEQLSSTESPVLKPPKLMDFGQYEIINIDEYKQVKVHEIATKQLNSANHTDGEELRIRKTKF